MSVLLLDTHAFIWFSEGDANLSVALREQIESANQVCVSIASFWEIAIKLNIGKLALQTDFATIEAKLAPAGITLLPILFIDTVQVRHLPLHHRDPFDRMLIAQAINRAMTVVSRDAHFDAYPVQRSWI